MVTAKSRSLRWITFFIVCLFSCKVAKNRNQEIESAMHYYDHLIKKLDADSIALLYAPDGNLGGIAIGRDSIRNFLASFKNVEVLSQMSTTSSISFVKDTALQKGTYIQKDIVANKDTITVTGEYTAKWVWLKKEGWRIKQMNTKPAN